LPRGRLVEVPDAYVLSMLDQPDAVAAALGDFLTRSESSAA
jgi:pimeloyl-ACP methyl ester carboxylesterase